MKAHDARLSFIYSSCCVSLHLKLLGALKQNELEKLKCQPLNKLGNLTLNPCGLIANTLFNDVFEFIPSDRQIESNLTMVEDGIAWQSDLEERFRQPDGFEVEECDDCNDCSCEDGSKWSCYTDKKTDTCYRYFYPDDDTTQYLYETYPDTVSPIEGVMNEHL